MEQITPSRRGCSRNGFEENIMAILDASGARDSRHIHDDRLSFLKAVRAASINALNGTVPTIIMYDGIFEILKHAASLELAMASYKLLLDLDKMFPRVHSVQSDEIEVVQKAWSPFSFGSESGSHEEEISRNMDELIDAERFFILIQEIAQAVNDVDSMKLGLPDVCNMLLFRYLVIVLEKDFVPRSSVYKETKEWSIIRDSLLQMLLGSRRLSFKNLIKECMSFICSNAHDHKVAMNIEVTEQLRDLSLAVHRLLTLIMELDIIKKEADKEGLTCRADGFRIPLLEIIVDELTYDRQLLSPFLKVYSEPKWKLEIILQYVSKYCTTTSCRTRRSTYCSDVNTFEDVLKCFSNETSARNIGRRMGLEVAHMLLAHGFQAVISMNQVPLPTLVCDEKVGGRSLLDICQGVISSSKNLRRIDQYMEVQPYEKAALSMAAIMITKGRV